MATLQDKLTSLFRRTQGFTPDGLGELNRELRRALLAADVALPAVKSLTAAWETAFAAVDPANSDEVFAVVEAELVAALGQPYELPAAGPVVILLVGLQGAGKTTTAGKLAKFLSRQGRRPILVGADLARPAAVRQLELVASRAGAGFFSAGDDPAAVASAGLDAARSGNFDVCIIDTAGRTSVDAGLLTELAAIRSAVTRDDVGVVGLLVIDAGVGQDGLGVAGVFADAISINAMIISKSDGDARGGIALSASHTLAIPIAFTGSGEGLDDLEMFDPGRFGGRLMGRGDVVALVGRVADIIGDDVVEDLERLGNDGFTFDDYLRYAEVVKGMGSSGIARLLPGSAGRTGGDDVDLDNVRRLQGIGASMTALERSNPDLVTASKTRVFRVARGAGVEPQQVRGVIEQFNKTAATISKLPKRMQRKLSERTV